MKRKDIVNHESFLIRLYYNDNLFSSEYDFSKFSSYILENTSANAIDCFHNVVVEFEVDEVTPRKIAELKEELTQAFEKYKQAEKTYKEVLTRQYRKP